MTMTVGKVVLAILPSLIPQIKIGKGSSYSIRVVRITAMTTVVTVDGSKTTCNLQIPTDEASYPVVAGYDLHTYSSADSNHITGIDIANLFDTFSAASAKLEQLMLETTIYSGFVQANEVS